MTGFHASSLKSNPGAAVLAALLDFKPYVEAQRVSVFLSMPSGEVQTDAIVRHSLASGKQVFVPYLHKPPLAYPGSPPRLMDMVQLKSLADYESLKPDRWGIPSIDPVTIHERRRILGDPGTQLSDQPTLDLILVPGVAFDVEPQSRQIRRCGHGKGFYDLFIERYASQVAVSGSEQTPPILLCGIALCEQVLLPSREESVPVGPFDKLLDGLVSGDGTIREYPKAI